MRKFVESARHGIQSRLQPAEGSQSESTSGRDGDAPPSTKHDANQLRHSQEENAILKEELQRLTAQLVASEDESRERGTGTRTQAFGAQDMQQLQHANSLLQAKVDMLRDNLKAARVSAAEKAALESEIGQLKERLAAAGHSPPGVSTKASLGPNAQAAHPTKQTRSLSEDGSSQSQLWMQLDALQNENAQLAEANHVLSAQLGSANAQRGELQSRWNDHERLLRENLASAQAEVSRLEEDLRAARRESKEDRDGTLATTGKSIAELGAEIESLHQTNRMLTDQIQSLQAKADEARQTVEIVSAENAQLGAHVQLLESELEAVQAGSLGQQLGSNDNSPRGLAEPPLGFQEAHGVTAQATEAQQLDEDASPAFSLIENSAFDQDGSAVSRPSTAGSGEGAGPMAADEAMPTSEKAEADFHFSSLKRKWHAEEGKYLAHELRRAQDLNVQQEMELESLRQQVAALSRVTSQEQLEALRKRAAQADAASQQVEELQAEVQRLTAASGVVPAPEAAQPQAQRRGGDRGMESELVATAAAPERVEGSAQQTEQADLARAQQLERTQALATEAQAEAAGLRHRVEELSVSLREEKAQLADANERLQAQAAQHQQLQQDIQLKAQGAEDDKLERVKSVQQLEAKLQAAHKDLEGVHSLLEAEHETLASKDRALIESVYAIEKAKAAAEAEEGELALKAQIAATEQASRLATSELEAKLAAVTSELAHAQVALADKDRECAELKMTTTSAQAEITLLQDQLVELRSRLEAASEVSGIPPLAQAANGNADRSEALTEQLAAAESKFLQVENDLEELQKAVSTKDDAIGTLKRQLEAASARADGHYAALQEINEQVQDIQRSHVEALQKSTAAVQEKERVLAETEKVEKAHAAERQGLKDKLERLQRANKQRRSEIEEMQTKLSSMHQRASAYDQTFQELQQLRKEHSEIKPLAAVHAQLVEELSASRAEVKAAEKRIASFDALAKKAATVFEARLSNIERERDQLLEQVAVLKSTAVANEALQVQAAAAQRDLTAAQEAAAAAASHQQRAAAAEKATAGARKEAQAAQAAAAAMEERLHAAEEEMDRITGAVEEERARRAAAARAYAEELEGLPLKPVSAWPAPVRALVRQREAAAAEAAATALRQEASAAEAALEAELEEARAARETAEAEKWQALAARDKADAHTAGVSKELAEREECLGKLLDAARAEAAAATQAHEAELADLRQSLELRMATVRADAADWQARAEAAEKDLATVKERAWALMEEKDAQLQAAKASKTVAAESLAEVDSPLPLSHSASTSTLDAALQQTAQAMGPSQELRASQSSSPAPNVLSCEAPALQGAGGGSFSADEISVLKQRILLLEKELVESENTHRLRDQAQAVAKQEIAELQRQSKREGLDLTYLKNVILGGFESGELPAKSSMLPVLGRLLEFSSEELHRVKHPKKKA